MDSTIPIGKDYRHQTFSKKYIESLSDKQKKEIFSHADLRGVNLSNQNLEGFNFSYANLGGAKFARSILRNADFKFASGDMPEGWKRATQIAFLILSLISGIVVCYSLSWMLFIIDPFSVASDIFNSNKNVCFRTFEGFSRWINLPFIAALSLSMLVQFFVGVDIIYVLVVSTTSVFSILFIAFVQGQSNVQFAAGAVACLLVGFLGSNSGSLLRAQAVSLKTSSRNHEYQLFRWMDPACCTVGVLLGACFARHYHLLAITFSTIPLLIGNHSGNASGQENDSRYQLFSVMSSSFLRMGSVIIFRGADLSNAKLQESNFEVQYIDAKGATIDDNSAFSWFKGKGGSRLLSGLFPGAFNTGSLLDRLVDTVVFMAQEGRIVQNFNGPIYGNVAAINEGNMTAYSNVKAREIIDLIKKLEKASQQASEDGTKELAKVHLGDLALDVQQSHPDLSRLKTRIIALFGVAMTIGGAIATGTDFANNVLDLSDKVGVPTTEIQQKLLDVKHMYPAFKWEP